MPSSAVKLRGATLARMRTTERLHPAGIPVQGKLDRWFDSAAETSSPPRQRRSDTQGGSLSTLAAVMLQRPSLPAPARSATA